MPRPSGKLSERERRFVRALTGEACGNITKAALTAGCSEKSAARIGHRMSKRVRVVEAIQAVHAKLDTQALLTAEEIDREIAAGVRATPEKAPTWGEKAKFVELAGKRHKMWDEQRGSRIIVNVGFLTPSAPTVEGVVVLPAPPQALKSSE